jgi:hypothetical protein
MSDGPSNDRVAKRRYRQRFLPAKRVVAVGLVCFGAWLFLDARQLYQSANASPIGVRRSVAMAILAPIARVEETLSLDRVVNVANRLVGKGGTPGGSAVVSVLPSSSNPKGGVSSQSGGGKASKHGPSSRGKQQKTPKTARAFVVSQPSAAKPLTILDVGDSVGVDLGFGLTDALSNAAHVHLLLKSVGDTGLANLAYYNWIAQLPTEITTYRPGAIVVMLGGNDGQAFQQGNAVFQVGTAAWKLAYNQRVGQMMSESTNAGIPMIWVGLPIMGPSSGLSNTNVELQNSIYAAQAKLHPGVTFVSSWKLFENAAGQYSTYLPGTGGGLVQVRDADETHIDPPGGTDRIGTYVVAAMRTAWRIKF